MQQRQKVYAFVDEAGQDDASDFFVVVAVVTDADIETLRRALLDIEQSVQIGNMKWHKTRHERRIKYIETVLGRKIAAGEIYVQSFKKPVPFFYPMLKVLERGLSAVVQAPYKAYVHVDGIDIKKAKELTNALRGSGFSLGLVRSRRDESEPLIRLADMWAGLMRGALRGSEEYKRLLDRARKEEYLKELET